MIIFNVVQYKKATNGQINIEYKIYWDNALLYKGYFYI
jgi:hypothetical protein